MTAPWNGLPDQPERSGWHVIITEDNIHHTIWWNADTHEYCWLPQAGKDPGNIWTIKHVSKDFSYAGAVYSSSELAQMRKDERERDDRILLPTYEYFCNDAKGLMSCEFKVTGYGIPCQECDGAGENDDLDGSECEACNGEGYTTLRLVIPWTTIKSIYRTIVDTYGPRALTDDEGKKS